MLKTLLINDDLYTLVITLTFGKPDGAKVKFACEQRRYVSLQLATQTDTMFVQFRLLTNLTPMQKTHIGLQEGGLEPPTESRRVAQQKRTEMNQVEMIYTEMSRE